MIALTVYYIALTVNHKEMQYTMFSRMKMAKYQWPDLLQ